MEKAGEYMQHQIIDLIDSDAVYKRIDAMTGPEPWNELKRLLLTVAAGNGALYREMEERVLAYACAQTDAALQLGGELAPTVALLRREVGE